MVDDLKITSMLLQLVFAGWCEDVILGMEDGKEQRVDEGSEKSFPEEVVIILWFSKMLNTCYRKEPYGEIHTKLFVSKSLCCYRGLTQVCFSRRKL